MPVSAKAKRPIKVPARGRAKRPLTIDVHTHISVPEASQMLRARQSEEAIAKHARYAQATRRDRGVVEPMKRDDTNDPKLRLAKMDTTGIDIQLVSVNTSPPYYALDGKDALEVTKVVHEGVVDYIAHAPDRFVGLGNAPLQSASAAIEALEHAMDLGLKGVNILTNVNGHDLGEEQFWPFWKRAEELNAAVFLHPLGFTNQDRFMKFRLANTVGQPLEETLAMLSLIHEGILAKFPKLKIVMAHGGGYLPFYYGRSDSTFHRDPHLRGAIDKPPSHYIRQFYLDTCVFDLPMIEFLAARYEPDRIVLGTDFPFRDWGAVSLINSSRAIGKEAKDRILWRNAADMLGLAL